MNKALSCECVDHYNLGDVLLCVFLINNPQVNNYIISFEYIKVYKTYMEFASTQYIKILNFYYNISCFKTILNSDRNKLLITGYCADGLAIFSIYNVNTNELHNSYIINHYFRKIYYNLQIKYFYDTDEYILSGLLTLNDRDGDNNYENDNIVFEFYHNNFNNYKYGWKYDRKCEIYGYSILYLKQKNSYYILSDINCNGTKYPFQPLLNENLQEDNITEELQIQNTVNYVTQNTDIFVNQSSENSQYTDPQFQNNSEIKENIFNSFIMNLTENIFDSSVENNILLNKTKKIEKFIHDLITEFNVTNNNKNNIIQETGEDNILITLTTTYNSKYHENKAKKNVDLDQCESILKSAYNISINDTLYIILIEIKEEGMKIPKVEYEIYYPLYHRNLSKLNLIHCKDKKIYISIPVIIDDNIDKYNMSSNYYNNLCSKTTSQSGTDISLKDRKKEFIDNNMTLCEGDCKLIDYNSYTQKAKCQCDIKLKIPLIEEIRFDKDKLYKSFTDIKNIANLKIMKCFKIALKCIKYNYGFFIISFIILLFFICLIVFLASSFHKIKSEINKIKGKIKVNKNKTKKNNKRKKCMLSMNSNNIIQIENPRKNKSKRHMTTNIDKKTKNSFIKINNKENENIDYKHFELNQLNYKNALKYDKRTYMQYYISLLRINHLLIFSFYPDKDYNSRIIKIFLFFFFFTMHLTINALFFNDEIMHKIYSDEGSFNFIYQIPFIFYSSLISGIINTIVKYLSLSQKNIVELKEKKNSNDLKNIKKELLNTLKIKFSLFFIFSFILLLFSWYYITCFCGIYTNTQSHLIKDSIISFSTSLIYPFIKCLIPGVFRIYSLNTKKRKRALSYKLSLLLQLI